MKNKNVVASSPGGLQASEGSGRKVIFAGISLGSLESKIFISMLECLREGSSTSKPMQVWRIPVSQLLPSSGGNGYQQLLKARHSLVSHLVDIEVEEGGVKHVHPQTLVKMCDHALGSGYILCQFHEHMKPFLEQLLSGFTSTELSMLKTINHAQSLRFYSLLKDKFEKAFSVIISVEECRECLLEKGSAAYSFPSDLRKHIIERIIQKELEPTDCAFLIKDTMKDGRQTVGWRFEQRKEKQKVYSSPTPPSAIGSKPAKRTERKGKKLAEGI